jgi:cyclopropane-fatty-acyl-phospholipid synthase
MSLHRWTGITVSKEQLAEAKARVKAAGLSDRITLMFCDYRYRRMRLWIVKL